MHLLVVILITYCSANIIGPTRLSRQLKDFTSTFNNFLQPDFKVNPVPYPQEINRIKIVYKTVEEPIPVEKRVPVPIVKHVPQPVPVYVPQPYPVEKKIFVPYKVYEKQHVPIFHRYPVIKQIPVPVQMEVLIPYEVPIGKRLAVHVPTYVPHFPTETKELPLPTVMSILSQSREAVSRTKDFSMLPELDTVKFPDEDDTKSTVVKDEIENSVFLKNSEPSSGFPEGKIIPFGTRISVLTEGKNIEPGNKCVTRESVQNSRQIQVITPAPIELVKSLQPQKIVGSIQENVKDERAVEKVELENKEIEDKDEESKKGKNIIVFPAERNDADGGS